MKLFFTILLISFSNAIFAQEHSSVVDSLSFCFIKYKVPEGCTAQSEYQVSCDNYSMNWLYLTPEMLKGADQFVDQITAQVKVIKKEAIACLLMDKEAKGYLISFKNITSTAYMLLVYGTANNQPVLAQLILPKEPKTNDDIPVFPRSIIRFGK